MIELVERVPDEAAAYQFLEEMRWGDSPVCAHCKSDRVGYLKPENGISRRTRTGAISQRRVWECGDCRKQFSVLTNTVMHGTKIPVRKWVFVFFEMASNKNGVAAREIERRYKLSPKAAWFMLHRIRLAMERGPWTAALSGTVTADETYIGGIEGNRHKKDRFVGIPASPEIERIVPGQRPKRAPDPKRGKVAVLTLIERRTGEARSAVVPDVTGATLRKAIAREVDMSQTELHTD